MLEVPEVSAADIAFPTTPPGLPPWDDIPEDFRDNWHRDNHPWCRIPSKWFYQGGGLSDFGLTPKDGIDGDKAMRAIRCCLGSWEPQHQHKIAGVAYMLSQWFDQAKPQTPSV